MLLRRISEHVKDQNWTAIALDFAIVVIGVFMGIQLGNWNEARAERAALAAVLANLDRETQANLDIIEAMNTKIDGALESVKEGRLALMECKDSDEAKLAVIGGVFALAGDFDPTFATAAVDSLDRNEKFLAQLPPDLRAGFTQYSSRLSEEQDQLRTNFMLAWQDHVFNHPLLAGDTSVSILETYSENGRPAIIVPSVVEACESRTFRRRYQSTSGFVYVIKLRMALLREDIDSFRDILLDE